VKEGLGIGKGAIRKEIEQYERWQPSPTTQETLPEPSSESLALLRDSNLIPRFLKDTTTLGVVGEGANKVTLLLAMTARLNNEPPNVVVKGESSGGKNHLVETVASCYPPSQVVHITSLSPQSLGYWQGDLKNKILLIAETEGSERADYSLRILQSEGNITIHYVAKVGGGIEDGREEGGRACCHDLHYDPGNTAPGKRNEAHRDQSGRE